MQALYTNTEKNQGVWTFRLTTEGYILLSVFFHRKRYAELHRSGFGHLADLGLVTFTERGIELVNNGITLLADENDLHIVVGNGAALSSNSPSTSNRSPIASQSIEQAMGRRLTSDREKQVIAFMTKNGKAASSQSLGLTQVRMWAIRTALPRQLTA